MIKNVLFPIDLHEQSFSLDALHFAAQQAEQHQAHLHVLTVLLHLDKPSMSMFKFDEDTLRDIEDSAKQRLDALIAKEITAAIPVNKVIHKGGTPYDVILRYANEQQIDLIVIPSHDKSALEKFFLGSCTDKIVRHAHCSVMVFRKSRRHGHDGG